MPNPIKLKRSAVAAAVPSSLEFGELALNYNVADGKLYYKDSTGAIVSFAAGGGGGSSAVRTFAVTTSGGAYLIDNVSNPTLTLERGQTYDLVINAAGHPFHFQTVPPPYSSGNLYTTGVTNSGTASGTIRIVVPYDAPSTLYYVCQYHGSMGGTINIVNANEDSGLRALFVPPAPTGVTATGGNAQAVVSWTAPTVLAQTPITDYFVQFSTNSGSTYTTFADGTSTATTATVTGLTNGTAHTFRVAGVNGIGTGAFSTASAAVTPVAPPPVEPDAYFSSVALLAPLDGNLTDFSSAARTITAASTPAYSSSIFKFNQSFLTTSNSLSSGLPSFSGTTWVVEAWLWVPSGLTTLGTSILRTGSVDVDANGNASGDGFSLGLYDSAGSPKIFVVLRTSAMGAERIDPAGFVFPRDQWVHMALVKFGGFNTAKMFINGAAVGSRNSVTGDLGGSITVGAFGGYVDDLRVTVGSDRDYGAGETITVPAAAFPTS